MLFRSRTTAAQRTVEELISLSTGSRQGVFPIGAAAGAAMHRGNGAVAVQLAERALTELEHTGGMVFEPTVMLCIACLQVGDIERAEQTLALVPPDKVGDGAVRAVQAAITLRAQAKPAGETDRLAGLLDEDPNDHQARYDLAVALAAADRKAEAIDHLLEIIKRNRTWNEDAARKQLLVDNPQRLFGF